MNPPKTLSETPSIMVRQATNDLIAVSKDPKYVIDMLQWHQIDPEGERCAVCLAGATLALRFSIPRSQSINKWMEEHGLEDSPISHQMSALNGLRNGNLRSFLHCLGIGEVGLPSRPGAYEDIGIERFSAWLYSVADALEKAGL